MVRLRRAEHSTTRRKRSRGPETRLTTPQASVKRRRVEDTVKSEQPLPTRRRSCREVIRKQTKASELTKVGRRRRTHLAPQPVSNRYRRAGPICETRINKGTASTQVQDRQSVPGCASDSSSLKDPQTKTGASDASAHAGNAGRASQVLQCSSLRSTSRSLRSDAAPSQKRSVRRQRTVKHKAATESGQPSDAQAKRQPSEQSDPASEGPGSPRSQDQQQPKDKRKRTHGTPHATFKGVKTSTAGITHTVVHPDIKQVWSAYVMIPSKQKHKSQRMLFLGKNYWTAEAAARAVDRATIALQGREKAYTNFPLEWYGPEVYTQPSGIPISLLHSLTGRQCTSSTLPLIAIALLIYTADLAP